MIKVGIIGCGKITEVRHAPEYDENPNAKIVAFYDAAPNRAQELADQYGAKACQTLEELLAMDLDAVSVCVANAYHAKISIAALNAGKHVLCEKPMATTIEDCEAMVQTAKNTGKFLMIGQNQRLAKAHAKAREIVESGELGKVITFQTQFAHSGPEKWSGVRDSWFFDKTISRFGAMADLGIHKTDLIQFLLGERVVKTSAVLGTLNKTMSDGTPISVDDNAYVIYTMESGIIGTLFVSWTNYGAENNSTKLFMEKGVIRLYDDPINSLIIEREDGQTEAYALDLLTSNKEQTTGGRTSTGIIDMFVNAIMTGTEPPISAESVLPAMKAVFASDLSAQLGHAIEIP